MQYCLLALFIILGFVFTDNKKVAFALLCFSWILFAFNRGNADYMTYKEIYEAAIIRFSVERGAEFGWWIICTLAKDIFHLSYEGFLLVISTFSLWLLYLTINRYTKNVALVLSLYVISPLLFNIVQIRNFLSFVIVLWGLRFLEKRCLGNTIKYCACVIFASTIHVSSLFFLLLPVVRYISILDLTCFIAAWCMVGPIIIQMVCRLIVAITGKYGSYIDTRTSIFTRICGLLYVACMCFICFQSDKIIQKLMIRSTIKNKSQEIYFSKALFFMKYAKKITLLGLIFCPFIFVTMEVMRLLRLLTIIDYIAASIPAGYPFKSQKQHIVRLVVCVFAVATIWFWGMTGKQWETVFLSIMENNCVIQFINQAVR